MSRHPKKDNAVYPNEVHNNVGSGRVARQFDEHASRDEWSLAACLHMLYRRKAILASITCLGILIAAALSARQSPVYQARAPLEIQAFNEAFLDLRDIYPSATAGPDTGVYMQTQVELLQQDALLAEVARKLHLQDRPEYIVAHGLIPKLRQDIKIVPVRNSRIIEIVSDAGSPVLAADLANTLAASFIEQTIQERQAIARQTYQSLLPELEELRHAIRTSPVQAEANRRVYDAMVQKADVASIASHLRATNVRLVNAAAAPIAPYKPNLPLDLGIGAIGGLLMGVASVMLHEQGKPVLRAPGEITTFLSLPELGAIPQAKQWLRSAIFFPGSGNRTPVERAALEERNGLSESIRASAASILSARRNGGHSRLLLVTSSEPREGKTTMVSNLGIALAATGSKVLLIDGDMRRPRLHKLFDVANSWGLSDVLREKNAVDELPLDVLAKKTSVPHLYLLPSGASTDNIFGLLHSDRISRISSLFREEFDYVLIDTPPCLEFADARIMARYAEELVLVVRANQTDRRTVQRVVQRLQLDSIRLMGVILNRWDAAPGDSFMYRPLRTAGRGDVS